MLMCCVYPPHVLLSAVAELKAEAVRVESEAELDCQTNAREGEIAFVREQNDLEIHKAKSLSNIEVCLFANTRRHDCQFDLHFFIQLCVCCIYTGACFQ